MKLERILSALNESKEISSEIEKESSENFLLNNLEKIKKTSHSQVSEELNSKIEKLVKENIKEEKQLEELKVDITPEEKEKIKEENSSEALENNKSNLETEVRSIKTINEDKEGTEVNGVKFERKEIEYNDEKIEGVFPIFESKIDIQLSEEMYKDSDVKQMRYCTKELQKKIENNPELEKKFTPRQLEQIKAGEPRISGLTWHHSEEPGKMQLVSQKEHDSARHTGGRNIWGGGSDHR